MPQRHQLGAKKGADLSRSIANAALGWGASVGIRIDPGVTTGATGLMPGIARELRKHVAVLEREIAELETS